MALFAALSYAITQSSRGGGASIDREQMQIKAAQVLQAFGDMRTAIQRMIAGGLSANQIRLHADNNPNPCTDTDGTCVFTPEGGGFDISPTFVNLLSSVNVDGVPNAIMIQTNEADLSAGLPSVNGTGSAATDAIIEILNVKKDFCEAVNKILKVEGIPVLGAEFDDNAPLMQFPLPGAAACIDIAIATGTPDPSYAFIYLLIER